jgi:predicted CXXCH cytochrome family protein
MHNWTRHMMMKQSTAAATVILILLYAQAAWAGTIFGSPHDFRKIPEKRSGEICLPCHVPHSTKTFPAPLWDLELSTDTYRVYASTRSPGTYAHANRLPDGLSKKCLSCHDGIIAPDVYGGPMGETFFHSRRDPANPVPGNTHPISFVYDAALAAKDKDLYDPSARPSGVIGSTGTIDTDMLFSKNMECASCHDVHNTKGVPGTKLLVKDTAGSTLCLTCHDK